MGCKREYASDDRKRVNRALWDYRRTGGMSHGEIARRIGVSASALSQFMNGQAALHTDYVLAVARLTGVEPWALAPQLAGVLCRGEVAA